MAGSADVAERFAQIYGQAPAGIWRAPGRANLIGDHTDYNGGLALPFAIERSTFVAARPTRGTKVRLWSDVSGQALEADVGDLQVGTAGSWPSWARYALGVVWAGRHRGLAVPGLDLAVTTELPLGSGLSSSAALTVSLSLAVNDLSQGGLGRLELARMAQSAEADFGGTPCGLLDQLAVLGGEAQRGVLINFSSLEVRTVPLGIGPLVIINTNKPRENSSGNYAVRRRECEEAALQLGVGQLSDATPAQVEAMPDGPPKRRARHVTSENARTAEAAARLGDGRDIGELLVASHRSLRDDFEVSCPELDLVVEAAMAHGASGARLTGAGFGGCAIALGADAAKLRAPLNAAFSEAGFTLPELFEVVPSPGAGRLA